MSHEALQDGATEKARKLCDRFVQGPLPVRRWREEIVKDASHVLIYPDIGMDRAPACWARIGWRRRSA